MVYLFAFSSFAFSGVGEGEFKKNRLKNKITHLARAIMFPQNNAEKGISSHSILFNILSDEQQRVQKKTFTNWINSHLQKVSLS